MAQAIATRAQAATASAHPPAVSTHAAAATAHPTAATAHPNAKPAQPAAAIAHPVVTTAHPSATTAQALATPAHPRAPTPHAARPRSPSRSTAKLAFSFGNQGPSENPLSTKQILATLASMTAVKPAKTDSKPAHDWVTILQRGLKAQDLAAKHQVEIDARIPPTVIPALTADLAALGAVVPAVISAKQGSMQHTAAQNVELVTCYALVTAARTAVKNHQPADDVSLAYGVGIKTNRGVVKEVSAAAQKIVNRAIERPEEAKGFGIIDADVSAIKAALAALHTADQAQETARAGAPLTTKERNTTARRIIAATKKIASAGVLAFATNATVRATFEALLKKAS